MELKMLGFSALLGILQLFAASQVATAQFGIKWNLSPRDKKMPELSPLAARLDRAFKNFLETFAFFVAAVFLVTVQHSENSLSAFGAQLYFYARLLYVPLYAAGIPLVRSAVWLSGTVGIVLVLSAGLK